MKKKFKKKANRPESGSFPQHTEPQTSQELEWFIFTPKKTWVVIISIILFLVMMLYFGYKDTQRQQQIRIELEQRHSQ